MKLNFFLFILFSYISLQTYGQEVVSVLPNWKLNDSRNITTSIVIEKIIDGKTATEQKSEIKYKWQVVSVGKDNFKIKETSLGDNPLLSNLLNGVEDSTLLAKADTYVKNNPLPEIYYIIDKKGTVTAIENINTIKEYLANFFNIILERKDNKFSKDNFPVPDKELINNLTKTPSLILTIYGREYSTTETLTDTLLNTENGSIEESIIKLTSKKLPENRWEINQEGEIDNSVLTKLTSIYNQKTSWVEQITYTVSAGTEAFQINSKAVFKIE